MFDYNYLSHYIIGWFQKDSVKQTKTQIQFSCGDRRVSSYTLYYEIVSIAITRMP